MGIRKTIESNRERKVREIGNNFAGVSPEQIKVRQETQKRIIFTPEQVRNILWDYAFTHLGISGDERATGGIEFETTAGGMLDEVVMTTKFAIMIEDDDNG